MAHEAGAQRHHEPQATNLDAISLEKPFFGV